MQRVQAALLPFHLHRKTLEVPEGLNLKEMVEHVFPKLPRGITVVVNIGDEVIPKEHWARVKPKSHTLIGINAVAAGGGGKKNPLAVILTIALVVAAPYLTAAIAPTIGASLGVSATVAQGIARIGISLVGQLATSMLSSTPKQPAPVKNPTEKSSQFIEGASNKIDPYGVIPVNLGKNRMFPPQAALPYTETSGNNQYARQIFTYGFGKVVVTERKLGETALSEYNGVEFNDRLNADLIDGVDLYSNDIYQEGYSVVLSHAASSLTGATTNSAGYAINATTITLASAGTGAITAGEFVTFANDTNLYKVTSGDADVSNGGSITIASPGLKKAIPASATAITLVAKTVRTTRANIDEAEIDVTFTGGLTKYNSAGKRLLREVEFEVLYAPTGTTDWSSGYVETDVAAQSFEVVASRQTTGSGATRKFVGYGIIVLNLSSGVVTQIESDSEYNATVPEGSIRIGSFRTERAITADASSTVVALLTDERAPHIPASIANSGDFALSYSGSGLEIDVADGTISSKGWAIENSTAEAARVTARLIFPTNGQYDISIRRITKDADDDKIRDEATLTAIRSITKINPINQENISGTAMRLLATDQLNSTVSSYNCLVSTLMKDYNSATTAWIDDVETSNPASIYRYVLQSPAFVKALPDAQINITKLEEWHDYCRTKNLTYNRIIDYDTSIDDLLNDIAAAGMATPHKINGIYSVIIDNERPTIKGLVTPRNSWGYSGNINYPDLPHALRVQFRNKDKGYANDERIVFDDGYTASNATLYERVQFDSCTDADLAWFYGRTYIATAKLQPEIHTWNMDFENLVFNRGDKIIFVNDVILVGVGQGRIKTLTYNTPSSPTHVTGFTLDEKVNIPTSGQFGVRIRHSDASGYFYYSLNTVVGETNQFTFTTPVLVASAPPLDSLCAFTEFGSELELVITDISMNKDQSARITAINYAPERFDAATGTIPVFNSNVTRPPEFYRPFPPELNGDIISDETVMLRNSDGSYITRMIIPLKNTNEPSVNVQVLYRASGATEFSRPVILSRSPDQVVLTGLQDGTNYDFQITYQRQGGLNLSSAPLSLNNITFEGASNLPDDVTGFVVDIAGDTAHFKWNPSANLDRAHSKIKYSRVFTGATWSSAQTFQENIKDTRFSAVFQPGTYLIKDVDVLGNESENAAELVTFDPGVIRNVVETLTESPTFAGTKTNVTLSGGEITLTSIASPGYYYFDNDLDLGDVFTSYVSIDMAAGGAFVDVGGNNVFDMTDVFAEEDIFGVGEGGWLVRVEYRVTNDDPGGSPTWTSWAELIAGAIEFRGIQFRVYMESLLSNITPSISSLAAIIDMPDRIEAENDLVCTTSGRTITFSPAFLALRGLTVTAQDMATGDYYEITSKTETGFTITFYNSSDTAVERTFDYVAVGYGRVNA